MGKFYAVLPFLLATSLQTHAQALSLDQLLYLRGKDVDAVNSYLSPKGWVFHDAAEASEGQYGTSTWAHTKQLYSGRAKSFFKLLASEGYYSQASYQTVSKVYYEAIRAKILAYKMVKVSAVAKDGYIATTYVGSNYQVETRLSTDSDTSIPTYSVVVAKKSPQGFLPAGTEPTAEEATEDEEVETEEEATTETSTSLEQAEPTPASEEVLLPAQVQQYKQRITGTYAAEPPVSDFIYLAEVTGSASDLIPDVTTPSTAYRRLGAADRVFVLSRLLDENHDYYLVYAGGYYGYVDSRSLKRFSL